MTVTIGMNYGHQSTYDSSQVDDDLVYLKRIGIDKIRVAMPTFNDPTTIANMQQVIQKAITAGFYVVAGVTSASNVTTAKLASHYAYVLGTFAPWCQSAGVDELVLDNELELRISSEVTASQARANVRALATSVKAAGVTCKLCYSIAGSSDISSWYPSAEGIGSLDFFAVNLYGSATPVGGSAFQNIAHNVSLNFGALAYISEFGCLTTGFADYGEEDAFYDDVDARITALNSELINKLAYFFCFRDGGFGLTADTFALVRSDGFVHLAMNKLRGLAVTDGTVQIGNATRRG